MSQERYRELNLEVGDRAYIRPRTVRVFVTWPPDLRGRTPWDAAKLPVPRDRLTGGDIEVRLGSP